MKSFFELLQEELDAMYTKPENIDTKSGCVDRVNSEPVAYMLEDSVILAKNWTADNPPSGWDSLYTSPPKREWQGLSEEDFDYKTQEQKKAMKLAAAWLKERNA
jgi:hypothetical protein